MTESDIRAVLGEVSRPQVFMPLTAALWGACAILAAWPWPSYPVALRWLLGGTYAMAALVAGTWWWWLPRLLAAAAPAPPPGNLAEADR
jgi:hypothetical protein